MTGPSGPGTEPQPHGGNPAPPPYGPQQPGYGPQQPGYEPQQPGYGPQPYGAAPGYGPQQPAAMGQPSYGPPPFPGSPPPPRRRGPRRWLIIGGGVLGVILVIYIGLVVAAAVIPKPKGNGQTASERMLEEHSSSAPAPSSLVSGRSGAGSPCPASAGSGPWQLAQPPDKVDFCGTKTDGNTDAQVNVNSAELWFKSPGGFGSYAPGPGGHIAFDADQLTTPWLGLHVYGFNGKFTDLNAAMGALEQVAYTGQTYYTVPPGPHGGKMQCSKYMDNHIKLYEENCVFATPTTLGSITFGYDITGFTPGISPDASAIAIRDTLEVPQNGK